MEFKKLFIREEFMAPNPIIKPMSFGVSLLFFGIPALVLVFGFHFVMPVLIKHGFAPFYAYFVALGLPLVLMIVATFVAYRQEGNAMSWEALKKRFRLDGLSGKMWLLTVGISIGILILYGICIKLNSLLLIKGIVPMPSHLPAWLDTANGPPSMIAMDQAFGGLSGNWMAFIAYIVFLIINVIGEELWWRGYILPRQELVLGKWVWVIHGLLWAFFHIFKWWDILALLPLTLIIPFLVWRYKNTSIGIVIHFIINGLGLIPILTGILI